MGHCTGAPYLSQWRSGREEREDGGEIGGEMGRRGERWGEKGERWGEEFIGHMVLI